MEEEKFYIDFLDCKNNFRQARKRFDDYDEAIVWLKENIEYYNIDMIHIL